MDQLWHSVFDNSMCQPWLYFCYQFDASIMNSFTLLIPYVDCHSVFIEFFNVYRDSVFADDLWISRDIVFLTIPSVSHDSIFAIDLMRRSWIHWCCRFHTSAVTQYSLMISRSTMTLFSLTIYGSGVTYCFLLFHVSAMTIFSLSIWCVYREFIDAVDSIRQLSLSFQWRFQVLQWLCFRWWFLVSSDAVFTDDSMRQWWPCFL
jgi:hypothetical protein